MRHLWLAGLLLVLAGCAHWELPPVTERSVTTGDWPAEVRLVRELPAADQPAELQRRQALHQSEGTNSSGLRLALLHTLGAAAVRDEARAEALLDALDPAALGDSQRVLADLLRQILRERQQAQARLRAERKLLAEQEARIRELESQLEAVTSIEQSIRQRQKPLQGVEP